MTTFIRIAGALLLAALLTLTGTSPASAHVELTSSWPAAGEDLSMPPAQVVLKFSEPVDGRLSQVVVHDANGNLRRVRNTSVATDGALVAVLEPSGPPGRWTVDYRVVGADGHPVTGRLAFSVQSPGAARSEAGGNPLRWSALGLALVVVMGAGVFLRSAVSRQEHGDTPVVEPEREPVQPER
jgi:methionine-rich copper-binding protein CopC